MAPTSHHKTKLWLHISAFVLIIGALGCAAIMMLNPVNIGGAPRTPMASRIGLSMVKYPIIILLSIYLALLLRMLLWVLSCLYCTYSVSSIRSLATALEIQPPFTEIPLCLTQRLHGEVMWKYDRRRWAFLLCSPQFTVCTTYRVVPWIRGPLNSERR